MEKLLFGRIHAYQQFIKQFTFFKFHAMCCSISARLTSVCFVVVVTQETDLCMNYMMIEIEIHSLFIIWAYLQSIHSFLWVYSFAIYQLLSSQDILVHQRYIHRKWCIKLYITHIRLHTMFVLRMIEWKILQFYPFHVFQYNVN